MPGQSAAKKAGGPQPAVAGRVQWRVIFEYSKKGKNTVLNYIGKIDSIPKEDQFSVLIEADVDNITRIEYAFSYHVTGYMGLDEFIELLKDLGVSADNANKVRKEIAARHPNLQLSFDAGIGDAAASAALGVSGNADAGQADGKLAQGKHSARVLQERKGPKPVASEGAVLPANWEEARAQVPGLRKWVEVKREAGLTSHRAGFDQQVYDLMVAHLRDTQTGLGQWATSKDGMPRNLLRHIDSGLRQELYSLGNPVLPPDINLPNGQPGRPLGKLDLEKRPFVPRPNQKPREPRVPIPSPEEAREARRIVRRAERAAEREK